ncbi:hypothetical protein AVEN_81348-1 [Araneus ventricosus]|uniref:Uncharacterized protein n=1 Tax=Araneus ventricosus TaxID=182803 RepID=A0A4Y2B7H5_ARAVE|nr:hypothetical protein AVEN_81348-1 [Araneus ventricosus]
MAKYTGPIPVKKCKFFNGTLQRWGKDSGYLVWCRRTFTEEGLIIKGKDTVVSPWQSSRKKRIEGNLIHVISLGRSRLSRGRLLVPWLIMEIWAGVPRVVVAAHCGSLQLYAVPFNKGDGWYCC